jgi:hypothetical protein
VQFPLITLEKAWHLGTLDIANKNSHSYEGSGLSISTHPEIWRKIAKLNGELFGLVKQKNFFLDFHSLTDTRKASLFSWGLRQGYVEQVKIHFYSYYDDEKMSNLTFESANYEEMLREAEDYDIQTKDGYQATVSLLKETQRSKIEPIEVLDFLAIVYSERHLRVDGVWWQDELNLATQSSPRGVIFTKKLSEWTIEKP